MSEIEPEKSTLAAVIANPSPLGLASAAVTLFVLSTANAGLNNAPQIVIGLAFFYGGVAQMLAGMWDFKIGNTFGATAFTSYGAFWIALGVTLQLHLDQNPISVDPVTHAMTQVPSNGIAYFLLSWTVFTGVMLLGSLRTNLMLVTLFALLFVTFLLSDIGAFTHGSATQIGGYFGIASSIVAWYGAAAGLLASGKSAFTLPVGTIK